MRRLDAIATLSRTLQRHLLGRNGGAKRSPGYSYGHVVELMQRQHPSFSPSSPFLRWLPGCCIVLLLLSFNRVQGQTSDLFMPVDRNGRVEVPFSYENNFIIVDVVFNRIFPLRFIIDTGAEHTILTTRQITDMLAIDYQRRFTIMGADLKTELYAYLVRGINLKLDDLSFLNRSILVLEEDYFRFDQFAGINVHGIIGADILRRFVVEINYRKETVTFIDPRYFTPNLRHYREVAVDFNRGKPYLFTSTLLTNQQKIDTKLLMDTGAALSLLLYTDTDTLLHLPEHIVPSPLGLGLGGTLDGYLGRIPSFQLNESFEFRELVTNFQQLSPEADSSYLNARNGIIGNRMLDRFTVVIDYIREKVYLRQVEDLDEDMDYDKSGIFLRAFGSNLNKFEVFHVIPDSPADRAGIKKGDRLVRINWWPVSLFNMEGITHKLRKDAGKTIRLVIQRDGEKLRFVFDLEELL